MSAWEEKMLGYVGRSVNILKGVLDRFRDRAGLVIVDETLLERARRRRETIANETKFN